MLCDDMMMMMLWLEDAAQIYGTTMQGCNKERCVTTMVLVGVCKVQSVMTPELQWALRTALDTDSIYVEEAFPHCLNP